MTTNITNLFKVEYQTDVHHVFQRQGSFLKGSVRFKDNVVGVSTKFNKVGKGTATTKSRHGQITPMNGDRSQITVELEDWYAGDWYDDLDSAKQETDEKMTIAKSGAMCLGRKVDELIITALDGTTNTGTFTVTSKAAILASMIEFCEELFALDVPNDGQNYAIVTPRCWSQMMLIDQFSRASYVGSDGLPFGTGPAIDKWKDWNGVKWQMHVGLTEAFTGTTASARKIYAYNKTAVGLALAKHAKNVASNPAVMADIQYHNDHASWFVNHLFSAGCGLIDSTGVVEYAINDSTAIATT